MLWYEHGHCPLGTYQLGLASVVRLAMVLKIPMGSETDSPKKIEYKIKKKSLTGITGTLAQC